MAQTFPLQVLFDLASSKLEEEARALLEMKAQWQQAESKLRQLQGYEEEYRNRLHHSAKGGFSVSLLRDYQVFLAKLAAAVQQQENEVERNKQRWHEQYSVWQAADRQLQAYTVLQNRFRHQLNVKENRLEQKELDEWARKFFHQNQPKDH